MSKQIERETKYRSSVHRSGGEVTPATAAAQLQSDMCVRGEQGQKQEEEEEEGKKASERERHACFPADAYLCVCISL